MSERLTVDELVRAAEQLIWELTADNQANPHVLLAGWARFRAGAEHYLLAASGPAWTAGSTHWSPPPGRPPAGAGDWRLERAGDLLGAAGDLIETHRDHHRRSWKTASDQDAQTASRNRAADVLAAGADMVVQAYARARQQLDGRDPGGQNIGAVAMAVQQAAIRVATNGTRFGPIDQLEIAGPPREDTAGQFLAAIRDWNRLGVAAADSPAPSSKELAVHAMAGDFLMAITSRLQTAAGQDPHLADQARTAWQQVRQQWTARTSAQPAQPETAAAARRLQRTAQALVAGKPPTPRRLGAILAETADGLATIATRHGRAAGSLALSGRLYAPARRVALPPPGQSEQLWQARAAAARNHGRWVPLLPAETRPLLDAYTRAATAAAALCPSFPQTRTTATDAPVARFRPWPAETRQPVPPPRPAAPATGQPAPAKGHRR